ncbi:MAG: hypothetical protein ABEK04_04180, partial [Candidatus Nanohalobium sp.]
MSEDSGNEFLEKLAYWFRTPEPDEDEDDNIWSDFHIFDGGWVELVNRLEWYESPNVPTIYEEHKYLMKENMNMTRPFENYYYQNVDSNEFESQMECEMPLPSGRGSYRIRPRIRTKSPPSGENNFCLVEYWSRVEIKYDMPKGVDFLPRLVARPLNRFFRWAFLKYIGEEMVEYDGEYAREKLMEYVKYVRKYHGEEPTQTKTRQAHFKPMPDEGV